MGAFIPCSQVASGIFDVDSMKSKRRETGQSGHSVFERLTCSVEETQTFGQKLGRILQGADVVALHGDLGSGKTTLVQGIAQGLGYDPSTIKSPTFVLMREYSGSKPFVHLDGYRLEGVVQVAWLDTELMFAPNKITLVEWADRFADLLPDDYLEIRLQYVSTHRRRIQVIPHGQRSPGIVAELIKSQGSAMSGRQSASSESVC